MNPNGHNRSRSASSIGHHGMFINSDGNTSPLPTSTTFTTATSPAISLSVGLDNNSMNQTLDPNAGLFLSNPYLSNQSMNNSVAYNQATRSGELSAANYNTNDFSLFQPTEQILDRPLFDASMAPEITSPSMNPSSPTTANLLKPEPHASPAMLQNHFSSPPGGHSRNASLGPQDALYAGQESWSGMAFQGHRRSPSEFSDVSSVGHSPMLPTTDNFDTSLDGSGHSPLQQPVDPNVYTDMNMRITNFTLSEQQSPNMVPGHSPSHSPAVSPRLVPTPMSADLNPPMSFGMLGTNGFNQYMGMTTPEAFPTLHSQSMAMSMAPPAINIQLAPAPRDFEGSQTLNASSLTPPERGRTRPRSVTDPYNTSAGNTLSPSIAANMSRDTSRSSTASRASSVSSAMNRRRQSTSSVPNNVMALRLADPEYQNSSENGSTRRVQKHPATFQCTLCPKRFTRAYNLRSHLRTHTDERPFVCTVCGKAFARQHDRKRHESLHSGEKKFVCKGELKGGGQWGCSRRFARADALGRHFRSEAGRVCIKPLLDEEAQERQRTWQEQQMAQNMPTTPVMVGPDGFSMDANGTYSLPQALLAQYPALAQIQMNWSQTTPNIEDDISGRSSFEASDYDDGDDGGYISGPGTGFSNGGNNMPTQNYDGMNFANEFP